MLTVLKINYLRDVEYIYEDGVQVATRHTDTGMIIPEPTGPYSEQDINNLLWLQEGGQEQQDDLEADVKAAMAKINETGA